MWSPNIDVSFQERARSFDLKDNLILTELQKLLQFLQLINIWNLNLPKLGLLLCLNLQVLTSRRYILLRYFFLLNSAWVWPPGRRGNLGSNRKFMLLLIFLRFIHLSIALFLILRRYFDFLIAIAFKDLDVYCRFILLICNGQFVNFFGLLFWWKLLNDARIHQLNEFGSFVIAIVLCVRI